MPLKDACFKANVSPEIVLQLLDNLNDAVGQTEPEKWIAAPFAELTSHIVGEHHDYVRAEGPRLLTLLQKVNARHEWVHPEVTTIKDVFTALFQELSVHMLKEEQVLFPVPKFNGRSGAGRQSRAACLLWFRAQSDRAHAGGPQRRGRLARADIDPVGRLSDASGWLPAPFALCITGSRNSRPNLHRHVHLENNILFPRALEMEKAGK